MSAASKNSSPMRHRVLKFLILFSLIGVALVSVTGFGALLWFNKDLPSIDSLKNYEPKEVSRVYSNNGEIIGEFFEQRRLVVHEIPEFVKNAFIAAEDSTFYTHQGVDIFGIFRAAYVNFKAGGIRQGASTITQQVARAFLLSNERTYTRKIKEIILAWQIEQSLTKEEILHLYLNHIYLGHGAYGVAVAAQTYFGKKLAELTIAEAAILGGLPQAPSRYSPARNPDTVKRRQLYVLRQMFEADFISKTEYDQAVIEDVFIEPRKNLNRTVAPYFVEYVRQYLMNKYGSRMVLQDGLKIYTTLNADMNRYGQNALRQGLSELEKRQGYRGPIEQLETEDDVHDYFSGRRFEERDRGDVQINAELEVSQEEAEAAGKIRMKPARPLEEGDFVEGVVVLVRDEQDDALVEYEPDYFARLSLADMKWAHERVRPDDDEQVIQRVRKVSQVVSRGDVIVLSVKSTESPYEGEQLQELRKDLDLMPEDQEVEEELVPVRVIDAQLEQVTEVEGALLSADPRNGYVRAMIGGYDFNRSEFNRAVQAKRQPGSAFKPITYTAALDIGFTPASILQDSPITFENELDEKKWRPNNYDRKFVGDTTLRSSLLTSRNITTIKLLNAVGIDRAVSYARRLGIESPLSRDFTFALGSNVVTLDEIIKPYIVFANGGYPRSLTYIKSVEDREGNIIESNVDENYEASIIDVLNTAVDQIKTQVASVELSKEDSEDDEEAVLEEGEENVSFLREVEPIGPENAEGVQTELLPGQVLSSETSYLMTHLLKENILYGSGRRARKLNRPASGKTGTTDDNRDAWFVGFTPQLVAGVWVGYDDLRRLGRYETGSRAAVPIWLDYMINATEPLPKMEFEVPENIEFARIDPKTGQLASSNTKGAVFEAFVKGTAPTKRSSSQNQADVYDLYQRDR